MDKLLKTMSPRRVLLIIAVVSLIFLVANLLLPQSVLAVFGLSVPFGGMVLFEIPCTCSAGVMLIVGPPKGGSFILTPASRIYAKYQPLPGHWVLGLADATLPCVVGIPPACIPAGEGPAIRMIGTS